MEDQALKDTFQWGAFYLLIADLND